MKLHITQQRNFWWFVSGSFTIVTLIAMTVSMLQFGSPVRLGLDFVGGTRIQLERNCAGGIDCSQPLLPGDVRAILAEQGLGGNSSIQILGDEKQGMSIRTSNLDVEKRSQLQKKLEQTLGPFDPQRTQIDTVGPLIGKRALVSGLIALLLSFVGILVYLNFRFQFDYAVLAIIALFHDVMLTVGAFSILGFVQDLEVDTLFIVALLTIAGFSVNDTVVIYDRIRETNQKNPDRPIDVIIDEAVNQTLGRSINTTLTVLLPLVSIFFLGGATLKNFVLALIIGFVLGAYSSIFIASSLLSWWREHFPSKRLAAPVPVMEQEVETETPTP